MLVVKVGGAEGNGIDNVLIDLAPRRDYVLVHGGSNEVDRLPGGPGGPAPENTPPRGGGPKKTGKETKEGVPMAPPGERNTPNPAPLQPLGPPPGRPARR